MVDLSYNFIFITNIFYLFTLINMLILSQNSKARTYTADKKHNNGSAKPESKNECKGG